jgi:ubiquinone/menaquinone biosynthesis C-methylase UbiE
VGHLQQIREYELELVLPLLPRGGRILEIGAGAGWQTRALAERGYAVEAIDTEGSCYEQTRVWPVTVYDGDTIPFADESFDAVFSSNVLEHIPHVERFQEEIKRVLKRGGDAVHILPSASWRIWTSATHYVQLFKEGVKSSATLRGKLYYLRHNCYPARHGERGSALTEIYTFSKRAWLKLFGAAEWTVEKTYSNRLFYTGHSTFDSLLSLRARHWLSYVLGSSCNIICLRKSVALPSLVAPQRGRPRAPHCPTHTAKQHADRGAACL